ncbi:MAG TPA: hypothetical protein VFN35_28575, partial [Ktedonobacteraceae bacterium]|nr:hypothetical protein [Ktedonobacteraceae bacterium]
ALKALEEIIMRRTRAGETLAKQKLVAFEQLQPEFEAHFHFIQEMHGQRRFAAFPVTETVHYLHALWVCEWKERLLSVHMNIGRYEGQQCLSLLRRWQEGETAAVVAFLQRKLGGMPFVGLTRQIQEAAAGRLADDGLLQRLGHGRLVLLNRDMSLMQAFDAIFALSANDLMSEVQVACAHYGHHPDQIEQQLAEVKDPLFSYAPHPLLAQRNMQVMNRLGMNVMILPTDLPGKRSWKIVARTEPLRPFAGTLIRGYLTLLSRNNLRKLRFVGRPKRTDVPR